MVDYYNGVMLAIFPLLAPGYLLLRLLDNPIHILIRWANQLLLFSPDYNSNDYKQQDGNHIPPVGSQLLAYVTVAILGYIATDRLVPNIKHYMLRKNIGGKDLGKRGTPQADKLVPEALGIVPGAIFLICLIFCSVGYASSNPGKLLDVNSALLSICFMLLLGFSDDILEWPWRYKLFLPSVASLPLLCCYSGSTSIVVPIQLRSLLMSDGRLTTFGTLISNRPFPRLIDIDTAANGSLIDLGYYYLFYMGLLAIFCANAINIFAGINGIEAGQSYIIGCFILVHNLIEIYGNYYTTNTNSSDDGEQEVCLPACENHLFSVMIILSFVGTTLGLLKHNWYPASIFVGDTFCYFAGMTFAVVGILGHFSKTLLLFFIPQVLNFLWSVPQLFKIVPCPRHRLPRYDPQKKVLVPSTFSCKPQDFVWLKRITMQDENNTEIVNMTILNVCLQLCGPLTERTLCILLLSFQIACCSFGLLVRYYIAQFFFDE